MKALSAQTSAHKLAPLLTTADVISALGISRTMLWSLEKKGAFPKAIRIGQMKRWQREDVLAFVDARKGAA